MSNLPNKQSSQHTNNSISINGDISDTGSTGINDYNDVLSDISSLSTTTVRQKEGERVMKNKTSSQQIIESKDQTNDAMPLTRQQKEEQTNNTTVIKVDDEECHDVEEEEIVNDSNKNSKQQQRYYYNEQTTYHLKKLFYETIGHGRKPTRQERQRLHEQTGVNPRKMTYYLSNMKRRHVRELQEFRLLVNERVIDGRYASYVNYCNRFTTLSGSTSTQQEAKEGEKKVSKKKK